jgi:hypothetical protein
VPVVARQPTSALADDGVVPRREINVSVSLLDDPHQPAGLPGDSTAYTKRKSILIRSTLVPETVAVPALIVP